MNERDIQARGRRYLHGVVRRFFEGAVAFAVLAVGLVEGLAQFPFLMFVRPACPGVAQDALAMAGGTADNVFRRKGRCGGGHESCRRPFDRRLS